MIIVAIMDFSQYLKYILIYEQMLSQGEYCVISKLDSQTDVAISEIRDSAPKNC